MTLRMRLGSFEEQLSRKYPFGAARYSNQLMRPTDVITGQSIPVTVAALSNSRRKREEGKC